MLYIFFFIISFFLTYLIKNYAIKKALYDIPNERSSHTTPTPHGGGIAIAITWFLGLISLFIFDNIDTSLFYALFFGGVIISTISYLDDLYELSPKIRLLVQTFVALLGLFFLGGFQELNLFLFTIENQLFLTIFATLMIVWFINLYNFLDGIDGYAGSEAIFLAAGGLIFFGGSHFLVLIAAVLGFLLWNWEKAKIFMGDVGSTLLGYNVAIFTIYYSNAQSTNFWIWIALFGAYWFDATYTLYKRYLNGEKLSQAHKKHAYQRLTQSGWSHEKVTLALIRLNIVLFLLVYVFDVHILTILLLFLILYTSIKYVDKRKRFV